MADSWTLPTREPTSNELDADGLVALPGLVDLHTHFREPGREDAETVLSGTLAAARGGFTAVLAMANTTPVTDTAEAAAHVAALGARDGLRAGGAGGGCEQGAGRSRAGRARADGPVQRPACGCSPMMVTACRTPA